ncbi:MAG: hypothetical protein WCA04_09740 [Geobacteraceae bacterium]
MNVIDKFLDALEAAIESKDETVLELLDAFATHLYQDIAKRANEASGEERVVLEVQLQRIKVIIAGLAKAGPDIW